MSVTDEVRTPGEALKVSGVRASYSRHAVLHGVSLDLRAGEFASLLGANGAGKTTLLNCIVGLHKEWTGDIRVGAKSVRGLRGSQIAKSGVCYVPEGRGVFPDLTVRDNLKISIGKQKFDAFFGEFPKLATFMRRTAGSLSGGEQQMVAMAAAVVGEYRLLLLDELSLGLAPRVVDSLFAVLETIRRRDVAIVMVEQFADRALAMSDTVFVMRKGAIVHQGPASSLRGKDETLRELYLGSGGSGERGKPADTISAGGLE